MPSYMNIKIDATTASQDFSCGPLTRLEKTGSYMTVLQLVYKYYDEFII